MREVDGKKVPHWGLLPAASARAVAERAARPGRLRVLANTRSRQGIAVPELGLTAVTFFAAGRVGDLAVSGPASVLVRASPGGTVVRVADPTGRGGPLTLRLGSASLARIAKLPAARFARIIKRIYGITPIQFIAKTRIAAASRLLRETERSIAEIALECGFYDHSAFTRAFRALTSVTPTQYRAGR